jgi:hypothetical protein
MADPTGTLTKTPDRRRKRPSIVITQRDVCILRDLFDSRILTAQQIADIHFNASRNAAKQRLWALKRSGYIAARFGTSPGTPEPIRLTREGFEHLRQTGNIDDYPRLTWLTMSKRLKVSDLTLAHEIDVGSMKAAFHRAAKSLTDTTIDLSVTWPRLLRFRVRPAHLTDSVNVSPDGFIRMTQADGTDVRQLDFFIEVDRSTETISRIVERMQAYVAYFATGGYAKRQGVANAEPRDFPFRVLWTFKTKARRESFLRACREHVKPIQKMAWAGVFDFAVRDPFGPCWRRPVDVNQADELPLFVRPSN